VALLPTLHVHASSSWHGRVLLLVATVLLVLLLGLELLWLAVLHAHVHDVELVGDLPSGFHASGPGLKFDHQMNVLFGNGQSGGTVFVCLYLKSE